MIRILVILLLVCVGCGRPQSKETGDELPISEKLIAVSDDDLSTAITEFEQFARNWEEKAGSEYWAELIENGTVMEQIRPEKRRKFRDRPADYPAARAKEMRETAAKLQAELDRRLAAHGK